MQQPVLVKSSYSEDQSGQEEGGENDLKCLRENKTKINSKQ